MQGKESRRVGGRRVRAKDRGMDGWREGGRKGWRREKPH